MLCVLCLVVLVKKDISYKCTEREREREQLFLFIYFPYLQKILSLLIRHRRFMLDVTKRTDWIGTIGFVGEIDGGSK